MDKVNGLLQKIGSSSDPEEICKYLDESQVDINQGGNGGWTAVLEATIKDRADILEILITRGGDVNVCDIDDWSPLLWAASKGFPTCLQVLLNHGASVYKYDKKYGKHALLLASERNRLECVRILLQHIDNKESTGSPNKLSLCLQKLKHKSVKNVPDVNGKTSLIAAASEGYFEILKDLVDYGSSINSYDHDQKTALFHASENGSSDCVQYLLDNKAKLEILTNSYPKRNTCLMAAAQCGHIECLRAIISHNSDDKFMDATNELGDTALKLTSTNGRKECASLLLDHSASVNMANNYGVTALNTASRMGHAEYCELLLTHGAAINQGDNSGKTPLMWASSSGHLQVMTVLLLHGANIQCRASDTASEDLLKDCLSYALGHSFISAKQKEAKGCVWLLLAAGCKTTKPIKSYESYHHKSITKAVQKLSHICRFVIRDHLLHIHNETNLIVEVDKLPIPESIKTFLLFDYSMHREERREDTVIELSSIRPFVGLPFAGLRIT